MRIAGIQHLAPALGERYRLLGQVDDLEQSILHYIEAIFLPANWDRCLPNMAQNLFSIARLLLLRGTHMGKHEDFKRSVIFLRYIRGQSPEAFNISPYEVNIYFISTLTLQIKFEPGDVVQDIEEMAGVLLELLNTDIWTIANGIMITFFVQVVACQIGRWGKGKGPPETVIDCLRKAEICLPESYEFSITLASTLLDRIYIAYSNDDYEEGTAILDNFLTSHDPDDDPSLYREALHSISMFALRRLFESRKPEHLEEAIYRVRNWLLGSSLEDPRRPFDVAVLKGLQSMHFEAFGVGAPQENDSLDSMLSGMPSFWDLIASLEPSSMWHDVHRFLALASALRMTDVAEIERAIEPCRRLLASFHPSDMYKPVAVKILGDLLCRAFCSQITSNTSTRQFLLFGRVSIYLLQTVVGFFYCSLGF
jgi:tetratricopeptide (TPR) repeat protein